MYPLFLTKRLWPCWRRSCSNILVPQLLVGSSTACLAIQSLLQQQLYLARLGGVYELVCSHKLLSQLLQVGAWV